MFPSVFVLGICVWSHFYLPACYASGSHKEDINSSLTQPPRLPVPDQYSSKNTRDTTKSSDQLGKSSTEPSLHNAYMDPTAQFAAGILDTLRTINKVAVPFFGMVRATSSDPNRARDRLNAYVAQPNTKDTSALLVRLKKAVREEKRAIPLLIQCLKTIGTQLHSTCSCSKPSNIFSKHDRAIEIIPPFVYHFIRFFDVDPIPYQSILEFLAESGSEAVALLLDSDILEMLIKAIPDASLHTALREDPNLVKIFNMSGLCLCRKTKLLHSFFSSLKRVYDNKLVGAKAKEDSVLPTPTDGDSTRPADLGREESDAEIFESIIDSLLGRGYKLDDFHSAITAVKEKVTFQARNMFDTRILNFDGTLLSSKGLKTETLTEETIATIKDLVTSYFKQDLFRIRGAAGLAKYYLSMALKKGLQHIKGGSKAALDSEEFPTELLAEFKANICYVVSQEAGTGFIKLLQILTSKLPAGEIKDNFSNLKSNVKQMSVIDFKNQFRKQFGPEYESKFQTIEYANSLGGASLAEGIFATISRPIVNNGGETSKQENDPSDGANSLSQEDIKLFLKVKRTNVDKAFEVEERVLKEVSSRHTEMGKLLGGFFETWRLEIDFAREAMLTRKAYSYYHKKAPGIQSAKLVSVSEAAEINSGTQMQKSLEKDPQILVFKRAPGIAVSNLMMAKPAFKGSIKVCLDRLYAFMELWAKEALFGSGFFQADTQPGNFMFGSDDKGRLVLTAIDFGNAHFLTQETKKAIIVIISGVVTSNVGLIRKGLGKPVTPEEVKKWDELEKKLWDIFTKASQPINPVKDANGQNMVMTAQQLEDRRQNQLLSSVFKEICDRGDLTLAPNLKDFFLGLDHIMTLITNIYDHHKEHLTKLGYEFVNPTRALGQRLKSNTQLWKMMVNVCPTVIPSTIAYCCKNGLKKCQEVCKVTGTCVDMFNNYCRGAFRRFFETLPLCYNRVFATRLLSSGLDSQKDDEDSTIDSNLVDMQMGSVFDVVPENCPVKYTD